MTAADDRPPIGRSSEERRATIAAAALEVLAAEGGRGLTHRAVDRAAGLPQGSASNAFRSRPALITGALDALLAADLAVLRDLDLPAPGDRAAAVDLLVRLILGWRTPEGQVRLRARYALVLESAADPACAEKLRAQRRDVVAAAAALLELADGDGRPARAAALVAWIDGTLLGELLDPASRLPEPELRATLERRLDDDALQL